MFSDVYSDIPARGKWETDNASAQYCLITSKSMIMFAARLRQQPSTIFVCVKNILIQTDGSNSMVDCYQNAVLNLSSNSWERDLMSTIIREDRPIRGEQGLVLVNKIYSLSCEGKKKQYMKEIIHQIVSYHRRDK